MTEKSVSKKDARQDRVTELLASGTTLESAAAAIGVSSRTIRRWRNADPEFDEAVLDSMCLADDAVERTTYLNCIDPDPAHNTLRMFWLKCRRPETYRDKTEQKVELAPISDQLAAALREAYGNKSGTAGEVPGRSA